MSLHPTRGSTVSSPNVTGVYQIQKYQTYVGLTSTSRKDTRV